MHNMAAAHASVHHVQQPHYANHPSALYGTLPSIRDLDLGIQPQSQSQPQQQQPSREQPSQSSPVYAQRPQYVQQSASAPVIRQDQWTRAPMNVGPQQASPLSQLPPHQGAPQYNPHVPLTPESASFQRSTYDRNGPYGEQPPLKRPRPNSRSSHAAYPPQQQIHAQSPQLFQYPQPPQQQQQQQHMHAHAMQPPPPPPSTSLPPTPTDLRGHSQHAAYAPAGPATAYPTPSPTQPPQYFSQRPPPTHEYGQRGDFVVGPAPQHSAPAPQLHQLHHQVQSQPQMPTPQHQHQQQFQQQQFAQHQHSQQQQQQQPQPQPPHHQHHQSSQPPPPPPQQQQQQQQQQHSRPVYAPQPWPPPQPASQNASQHIQQHQLVQPQPIVSQMSPLHQLPSSHPPPLSHSAYQQTPAQQHLQTHHSPAPQSPLYPYPSMQQHQQQQQQQLPQPQQEPHHQQPPQPQPQQSQYTIQQQPQQPINPAPYAMKAVAPPDLHIQVPRPTPIPQPPPQQMQVPVQTLLAPEPPSAMSSAMSVSPVEMHKTSAEPSFSPPMNEIHQHCASLYHFSMHYASKPEISPTDAEFAEMNKLAELVVRLLKDLQRQTQPQPSAPTPTFAQPVEDVQPTLEPAPPAPSAEPTRPPKRPWEDAAVPPQSGSLGENGGQPITLPESQTTAEADMELIRTKRATNGSGAASKEKVKYRKRSRANPPGKCHSCGIRETPEWRRGPDGARTLCNACGLHFAKLVRKRDKAAASNGSSPPAIDIATLRASARANGTIGSAPPSPQAQNQSSSQSQDEPSTPPPPMLALPAEVKPAVSQQQQPKLAQASYPPPVMPSLSGPAAAPGGWARSYPPPVQAHASMPALTLPRSGK